MSQENVETLRAFYEAFNRADFDDAVRREGIETEIEVSDLYTFRDGLIVRIDGFTDKAHALEAAGLSE